MGTEALLSRKKLLSTAAKSSQGEAAWPVSKAHACKVTGAGGRSRTGTGLAALRIFVPATAFAARSLRRIAPEGFGVWTIPSPWPCGFRCCPSSLYTFPFPDWVRDCHLTGFPEFGQFCIFGFPESTQVWSKSVASTSFATPAPG